MSTKIAVIFDFDDTLAPDSTSGFLRSIGVDLDIFWNDRVQPRLTAGWDPIPAYLFEMIEESRSRDPTERITRDVLRGYGRSIEFFPGVTTMFGTLRDAARAVGAAIDVEFYLISSGIGEIMRATSIAGEFGDIWACDFHYNDAGEIAWAKNIVSFTEKTRFLFQISKGLVGPAARMTPGAVNRKVRDGQFYIPMEHMIFVGDGHTDIPCFALLKQYGGVPIGVYDPDHPSRWDAAWSFIEDGRVANLLSAKFGPGDDLHNTLVMAVRNRARLIQRKHPLHQT